MLLLVAVGGLRCEFGWLWVGDDFATVSFRGLRSGEVEFVWCS